MAERKPTPEEQLLKLIENTESGTAPGKQSPAAKPKPTGKKGPGLLSRLFSKKAAPKVAEEKPKSAAMTIQIKAVNNVLIALVLAAGIYLALDLFVFKSDEAAYLSQVGTTDPVYPILGVEFDEADQEVSYYKEPLKRRNPFLSSSVEFVQDSSGDGEFVSVSGEPSASMADVLSGLTLVGISWGAEYPLAMVEDTATGRTHFLREGQEIQGVKIQTITKEKVIVTYEGEEGTLF